MLLAFLAVTVATGCVTSPERSASPALTPSSPALAQPPPARPGDQAIDLTTSLEAALAAGPTVEAPCDRHACPDPLGQALVARTFRDIKLDNDVPLRPPLRQLWFRHAPQIQLGDDVEFGLPDGSFLAHRDQTRREHFRNPYAGLRDQPVLHRDTSRASAADSTLSDVGPPPPRHTLKTFGTLTGLSLIGIGVYAWAPTSFTGADKENAWPEARDHFKEAWTKPPVIDKDKVGVNYLGHPYFGMQFYLSQRNYGESPLYSFLFSTLTSTCFEYFIESWSERPSIQDLIITPIVGSILGELVFRATQEMRKDGFTTAEKVIITVINPMYVLQNGYR